MSGNIWPLSFISSHIFFLLNVRGKTEYLIIKVEVLLLEKKGENLNDNKKVS